MKFRIYLLFLCILIILQISFAAGRIDSTFNVSVTEGLGLVSRTLTQPDGKIIVIGWFQKTNGLRFNNIVRLNADGTIDPNFNSTGSGANNTILAAALQTDGKILIGGSFTAYNGQTINRLARLNANGSLDTTFNPNATFNNSVLDIAVQTDGKILAAGRFSASTGQPLSSRIVRFNTDGTIDSSFQNNIGINQAINTIAIQSDGKVLVGGEFTNVGGNPTGFMARLNSDGTFDNTFSAANNSFINKITIQPNGKLLLAGDFLFGARRLNADGSAESLQSKSRSPEVIVGTGYDAVLLSDGKVLVAHGEGSGFATDFRVIRLNSDLTLDDSFQMMPAEKTRVLDINLLSNGKFIASGEFVSTNNQTHVYIARMNESGSVDSSFNPQVNSIGRIQAIKRQPDGKILIGGIFEYVNGIRKTNIARLNANGSLDSSFNIPFDLFNYAGNFVFDIELQSDGKIIVGRYRLSGNVPALNENIGGVTDGAIIRLNSDGSLDESFGTDIITQRIQALSITSDNKILMGGFFDNIQAGGTETFRKLMSDGIFDSSFNPPQPRTGIPLDILVQPDGKILVGGSFTTVGGNSQVGTVRYNADGTLDNSYSSILPNIYTLGLAGDGKIYAGGNFPISGGNVNSYIARLNPNGSIDSSFVGLANATVRDLMVQPDGKVIIGGDFTTYYSNSVGRLARINSNGSFDPTFNIGTGASGAVYALEKQADGKILVGGNFLDFNGNEKLSIVRLQNVNTTALFDFDGDTKSDISIFRPSNGQWWYQRSSDNQVAALQFGNSTDKIMPADYTGDGKTDIAVWRPSTGEWFILRSEDGSFFSFPFGTNEDIPVSNDFDGDGKADTAVFRPSNGTWFINKSSGGTDIVQFGINGDVPVVGDYDGDSKADIAIFRPSNGQWWLNRSSTGVVATTFGIGTDTPVQGDFTGDGKTDIAFWRPSTGEWFVLRSEDSSFFSVPFGATNDIPTTGDYDGDGKFDFAVFRPTGATWYVNRSTSGLLIQQFGLSTDQPVPSAFLP